MTKKVLTDKAVTNLKPADPGQRYIVGDAIVPGLGVRVTDSGHKTYVLGARYPGSPHFKRREIAQVGAITLAAARKTAGDWLIEIKAGKDPRVALAAARVDTLASVTEEFIKRHLKDKRQGAAVERDLRADVIPVLGQHQITSITRRDIVELIKTVADRGTTGAYARNLLGHLRVLFNWIIEQEIYGLEVSPCDRIKPKTLLGEKRIRTRVLDNDEIRAVWRAANRIGYPWGALTQFIMLTGCRLSEAAEASWSEFSSTEWTIPAARFKSGQVHIIPLTDAMRALLATIPRWKAGDHLFSTTNGSKPVSGFNGQAKVKLDREMARTWRALGRVAGMDRRNAAPENWAHHDLRRTVRTRLGALRVPENVAEMVIGHAKKGLARVYDQHRYADEIAEALTLWNASLESIVAPSPPTDNVVPLLRDAS